LSIDYGPVRDRTVLAVMHRDPQTLITHLDRMDVLQGSKGKRVPIEHIEQWIDHQRRCFNVAALVVDPYQLESTIQKYERLLPVERFEARGGKSNYEMAQALRHAVIHKQVSWPASAGVITDKNGTPHTLSDELAELIVRQFAYGYRIDHLPGLHDDRVVTLGMGLLCLIRRSPRRDLWGSGEDSIWF